MHPWTQQATCSSTAAMARVLLQPTMYECYHQRLVSDMISCRNSKGFPCLSARRFSCSARVRAASCMCSSNVQTAAAHVVSQVHAHQHLAPVVTLLSASYQHNPALWPIPPEHVVQHRWGNCSNLQSAPHLWSGCCQRCPPAHQEHGCCGQADADEGYGRHVAFADGADSQA